MSNRLEQTLERLTNSEYIVQSTDKDLKVKLKLANDVIKAFVSNFEKPEFICPELVEYLRKHG